MQKKILDVNYEPNEMDFLIKCIPKPGVENTLEWLPSVAWDSVQGLIQHCELGCELLARDPRSPLPQSLFEASQRLSSQYRVQAPVLEDRWGQKIHQGEH